MPYPVSNYLSAAPCMQALSTKRPTADVTVQTPSGMHTRIADAVRVDDGFLWLYTKEAVVAVFAPGEWSSITVE